MSAKPPHPHEKRFMRMAYLALVAAAGLAVTLAAQGEGRPFGVEVPLGVPLVLAAAGLGLGAFAVARRHAVLALGACALLALAVVPAGRAQPGPADYALGILFGVALLAFGELVHMTHRYDRAHAAAVEKEGVPEGHLDTVSDQAVKTLASRGLLAGALAAAGVLLAFLLSAVGPLRMREAVETTAHLGAAVATLALLGGAGLFILVRGARARPEPSQESAPDAVE